MDPDGSVLVWNLHMSKRPEFAFTSQSGVHTAQFHPAHPKLVVGACENGQLVIWDMRTSKHTPVNRSSLSHGHTHPVFALDIQPLASGVYQIVSASSDGQVCVWTENNLHKPLHDVQLVSLRPSSLANVDGANGAGGVISAASREDITTTCFDLPGRDTNTLLLGSDEGRIYKARLHDNANVAAHERIYDVIQAHDAPMSSLQFHQNFKSTTSSGGAGPINDLFLTSSFDWTVKLWSQRLNKPLFVFETARDYVHAASWCPSSPYVFASGDGTGRLDVWNLGAEDSAASDDVDVPAVSVQVGGGASNVGAGAGAAGSDGGAAVAGADGVSDGSDPAALSAAALASSKPNHAISALKWNHTGSMIACGSQTRTSARQALHRFGGYCSWFAKTLTLSPGFCVCSLSQACLPARCICTTCRPTSTRRRAKAPSDSTRRSTIALRCRDEEGGADLAASRFFLC
jgi:WD40 repeat protein